MPELSSRSAEGCVPDHGMSGDLHTFPQAFTPLALTSAAADLERFHG